ncbi:hypothetical protein ACFL3E_00490 [Patescibacteria group bacterium]
MKKVYIYITAFIGFSLVLGLWTFIQAENGEINACVKSSGVLYLTDGNCKHNETSLTWNTQGPQGEKGDKGDPGEPGGGGIGQHLFDADGQDLGILFNYLPPSANSTFNDRFTFEETYLPSLGVYMGFRHSTTTNEIIPVGSADITLRFSGTNCTGNAYRYSGSEVGSTTMGQYRIQRVDFGTPRYFIDDNIAPEFPTSTTRSVYRKDTKTCYPVGMYHRDGVSNIRVTEVVPFTEPLAWPSYVQQAP